MKTWQFFILVGLIINNGTGAYDEFLAWTCLAVAVIAMVLPSKFESKK